MLLLCHIIYFSIFTPVWESIWRIAHCTYKHKSLCTHFIGYVLCEFALTWQERLNMKLHLMFKSEYFYAKKRALKGWILHSRISTVIHIKRVDVKRVLPFSALDSGIPRIHWLHWLFIFSLLKVKTTKYNITASGTAAKISIFTSLELHCNFLKGRVYFAVPLFDFSTLNNFFGHKLFAFDIISQTKLILTDSYLDLFLHHTKMQVV